MAARLIEGPVGPGSTFTVLAAAEEAARAGTAFALVLPTRAAREHARNELARRLGACDPRAVTSLPGLARRILGAKAPPLATPRERDVYLAQALAELPGEDAGLALRFRGFRRGLLGVFAELEQNGLSERELERALRRARLDPSRATRLHAAYRGYRERLAGGKRRRTAPVLATEPDLLHRATLALKGWGEGPDAVYPRVLPALLLLDGYSDLSPRQVELLRVLAARVPDLRVTWPTRDEGQTTTAFEWTDLTRAALLEAGFEAEGRAAAPEDPRPPALRRIADRLFAPPASPAERVASPNSTGSAEALDISAEIAESAEIAPCERRGDCEATPASTSDSASASDPTSTGLCLVRAASREDEVEYALARARAWVQAEPCRRWNQALIIVPDVMRYRAPLERVGRELGVPVRVRGPLPLSRSPLVQGALCFLRAAASFELAPLLVAAACPAFGLHPDEADRLSRAARRQGLPATGAPELWLRLARELGGPAGALLERCHALGHELSDALREARDRAEEDAFREGELDALLRARPTTREGAAVARRALDELVRPTALALLGPRPDLGAVLHAADEAAARRQLLALLADLERLAAPLPERAPAELPLPHEAEAPRAAAGAGDHASLAEVFVARVEEEVNAARYEPTDRRRDVLHAVDVREARAWEADAVFVLGLVEREFPRPEGEDAFLPEATRRALSGRALARGGLALRLPVAAERAAEERFLFYAAATRARRALWLLYPGFTASGTPRSPSRFLSDVEALFAPEDLPALRVERTPGDLVSDEPELLLTTPALRRFAYRRVAAVARPDGREAERVRLAAALFEELLVDPLERARAALALQRPRARRELASPAALRARALSSVYSASELEAFATCPFRHFVRYQLGARPVDDLASRGLDALRQGRVVHGALERVYAEGEEPIAAFEREFQKMVRQLDVGMDEDAFRRQALAALLAFVHEDDPSFRARTSLEPWGFELPFGPETEAGPLVIDAPELGGQIRLRGQIDRIDLVQADVTRRPSSPSERASPAGSTTTKTAPPSGPTPESAAPEGPREAQVSAAERPHEAQASAAERTREAQASAAERTREAQASAAEQAHTAQGSAAERTREAQASAAEQSHTAQGSAAEQTREAQASAAARDLGPSPESEAPPAPAAPPRRPRGFVTDYKLGGREVDSAYLSAMHQGARLQVPLYLLALERVFGVEPLGAAFAALGTRRRTGIVEPAVGASWEHGMDERRVKLHKVPLRRTLERAEEHVRRIVAGIAQGLIEPLPSDVGDCDRCDARDVCRLELSDRRRVARRGRPLPVLPPEAFLPAGPRAS
ncbi:MAG: PD-(D/E)XK nuclease family protein [Planctomycetota bacterium]